MASVCESETSVKRQKKSPAPGDEPPSVPDEVALPDKYRALRCRYCMNWSTSTNPFELLGTLLAAWHPFLPWGRGKRDKPIGDKCKLCVIVLDQGGFLAEFKTEDAFQKAIADNPATLHEFLAVRGKLVKLKQSNPNMRFRLEANQCTAESVRTSMQSETGLEEPEEFWVELSAYELEYGPADPSHIVYEERDGVSKAGVNVRTGKSGWHKRVNRNLKTVTREATLTDGVEIDPSRDAVGKIHAAAKAAVLKRKHVIAKEISMIPGHANAPESAPSSSSRPDPEDAPHEGNDDGHASDASSQDDAPTIGGFLSNIKAFVPAGAQPAQSKAKAKAAAAPVSHQQPKAKATSKNGKNAAAGAVKKPPSQKVAVGAAASKRRRVQVDDLTGGGLDGPGGEMMEADKELLSAFVTRFDELKILEPPVADAPFKSYLNDLVGKLTSLKTEFRNKRRSAIRRHEKEQDPLALALADLTVKADALTHLLKCLMGTAQVDSDITLIRILDLAEQNDGIKFNGAVIRRGLKSLINMDFRLEKWGVLVSDTYKQVLDRFVDGDDSTSANDFYVIMISQVFQKLLRTSQTKFKIKDSSFTAANKSATEITVAFLSALATAETPPKSLIYDASSCLALLTADTVAADDLVVAIKNLDKLKAASDAEKSKWTLLQVMPATSLGQHVIADARGLCSGRQESTEELDKLLEQLQALVTSDDLVEKATLAQKVHDSWAKLKAAKMMAKEAVQDKYTATHKASCRVLVACWSFEVTPWLQNTIKTLGTDGVFQPPTLADWKGATIMAKVDSYKAMHEVLSTMSSLSNVLSQGKGCDVSVLHSRAEHLANTVNMFKVNILDPIQGEGAPDILTDIVSFRTTIDTVKNNCIVAGASQHLKELSNVLVEIYRMKKATSPKPDDEIEKTQNTVTNEVEQLRLRAASLPQDDGRKSTWAMLADLISHYWTAGVCAQYLSSPKMASLVCDFVLACQKISSYTLEQVKTVVDTIEGICSISLPFTAEWLHEEFCSLAEDSAASLDSFWASQEKLLVETNDDVSKMNLPSPSLVVLSQESIDAGVCDRYESFECLAKLDATAILNLQNKSYKLKQIHVSVEDAVANIGHGCPDKVQKLVETSKSCYVHMLSLLATAALVKTLSSKRFVKAVNQAESIPDNLISNLSQTMSTCQELSLDVPGSLQALAGKYIKNNSGTSK